MRKIFLCFFILFFLNGCRTIKPLYFDGKSITYQHSTSHRTFERVMLDAKEKCALEGKLVRHERIDCIDNDSVLFNCISTFLCIDKISK